MGKNTEIQRLQLLFQAIGVSPDVATTLAAGLRASWSAQQQLQNQPDQRDSTGSVLMPVEVADLAWYGIDPKVVRQIEPFVQLIPIPAAGGTLMPINANTAPAEVLMAACPTLTRAQAEQVILRRRQKPFDNINDVTTVANMPAATACGATADANAPQPPSKLLTVKSQYFEIYGQLRYEQHVIRERSVVYRKDKFTPVQVLRRERLPPDAA